MPRNIGEQMDEELEELEDERLEKILKIVGSYISRIEKASEDSSNSLPEPFYETYVTIAGRVITMVEAFQKMEAAQRNFPMAAADLAEQLSFAANGNYETDSIYKLVDKYQEQIRAYNERRVVKKVDDLFPPSGDQFTDEELASASE